VKSPCYQIDDLANVTSLLWFIWNVEDDFFFGFINSLCLQMIHYVCNSRKYYSKKINSIPFQKKKHEKAHSLCPCYIIKSRLRLT